MIDSGAEMNGPIIEQVIEKIAHLSADEQRQVLEFVESLEHSVRGAPGVQLARFAGAISAEDLQLMQDAIEAGCEQIDVNEW